MSETNIRSICVCGAGTMGSGIALSSALGGFRVMLYDMHEHAIADARQKIGTNVESLLARQRITSAEADAVQRHISFSTEYEACVADVIIEAIVEDLKAKADLLAKLASVNSESTILATNTSSLPVTSIAESLPLPSRVIGMHFFNPAHLMKLVEVVVTDYTEEATKAAIVSLAKAMKKVPVVCKDAPGFIVNHVARPFYIESLLMVEHGEAEVTTIDRLLESAGFKMGPFRLMDLIGNDINYTVSTQVYNALGQPPRLKPSPLQEQKVHAGELGRKTGKGYYEYSGGN